MLRDLFQRFRAGQWGERPSLGVAQAPVGPDEEAPRLPPDELRRRMLRDAFTPMYPQRNAKRFVGRREQIARILQVVEEEQGHVAIYGERGRGKTSLANLAAETLRRAGYTVARHACTAEGDFDAIIRSLARDLPRRLLKAPLDRTPGLEGCEAALPEGRPQPGDVAALPSRLVARRLALMVDEFDRVQDDTTRTRLADTIKQVSDRAVPISFIIVGVSGSLEQLLGRHPSIQRNVVGVPLPLLSHAEIEDLILRGAQDAGLEFPPQLRAGIAALARGVPYYAQLLALRAGQAALERQASVISGSDLRTCIERTVAAADPRVVALYESLTEGGRAKAMVSLLRAIAAGPQNRFGQFRVEVTEDRRLLVAGASADPALWKQLLDAGAVRPFVGANLFTFGEASLRHYVLLAALGDRLGELQRSVVASDEVVERYRILRAVR